MSVWSLATVDIEPEIRLHDWRVVEATYADSNGRATRHFVGRDASDGSGRVSSAIASLDLLRRVGVTKSGRSYLLLGTPGHDADAQHVWGCWRRINRVNDWTDVTTEVSADMSTAERPRPR